MADQATWKKWENVLFWTFIVSKLWIFEIYFGRAFGYDWMAIEQTVEQISWLHPILDFGSFYNYHPPLGFLLMHTFKLFGFTFAEAAQLIALGASLCIFLCIRCTLQKLQLLEKPVYIAFLYIANALPVFVFICMAVGLDMLITAIAAALVLRSVYSVQSKQEKRIDWSMTALLVTGMSIKFSGWALTALPVFAVLLFVPRAEMRSQLQKVIASCILAIVIVVPYYIGRNVKQTGSFFPHNITERIWMETATTRTGAPSFLINALQPSKDTAYGQRDLRTERLKDTWDDIWILDSSLGHQHPVALPISILYLTIMPWLLLLGLGTFVLRSMKNLHPAGKFGIFLFAISCTQIAALLQYAYTHPSASWAPLKAIYILPATWFISWCIAHIVSCTKSQLLEHAFFVLVFAFVVLNHTIPVY